MTHATAIASPVAQRSNLRKPCFMFAQSRGAREMPKKTPGSPWTRGRRSLSGDSDHL
jgi:hypothetical protein